MFVHNHNYQLRRLKIPYLFSCFGFLFSTSVISADLLKMQFAVNSKVVFDPILSKPSLLNTMLDRQVHIRS